MSENTTTTALTEDETTGVSQSTRPHIGNIVLASLAAAAIAGGGVGLGVATSVPVPQPADYAVSETGALAPTEQVLVEVHNPHGVLSAEDEARVLRDAERIDAPVVVEQLHYLVFEDNDENINDTVENYLRDNRPDLIGDDYFADGILIVGVGLDPRQSFVLAGEDVADALQLRSGRHLDEAVTAIQPGVRDGNIPGGLFAGANTATDIDKMSQADYESAAGARTGGIVGGGIGAAALALLGVGGTGAFRRNRSRKIGQARAEMDIVSKEYGQLAGRLDQIDIRAHSLSSPFANATMRKQWEQVRGRFLEIHAGVDKLGELDSSSADTVFLTKAEEITAAALTTRQVSYAEDNIDKLFQLEHGDDTVRRTELHALRDDVVAAQVSLSDTSSGLYRELNALRDRADALTERTHDARFLDDYVVLLTDYRTALAELRHQEYSDLTSEKTTALEAPRIYDRDWRPGYGYHDFVPFWVMSSWHSSNLQAQQAAQSSATTSSFSSGFSGAGGSSSF